MIQSTVWGIEDECICPVGSGGDGRGGAGCCISSVSVCQAKSDKNIYPKALFICIKTEKVLSSNHKMKSPDENFRCNY